MHAAYAKMEEILSGFGTLEQFLASDTGRVRYFAACQQYFGREYFNRESFETILAQLSSLIGQVPLLKQRLWETTEGGRNFVISSKVKGYGRALQTEAWQRHLDGWIHELRNDIGEWGDIADRELKNFGKVSLLTSFQSILRALDLMLDGEEKPWVRDRIIRDFYIKARANERWKLLRSWLILQYINSSRYTGAFSSDDADLVLSELRDMRQEPLLITSLSCGKRASIEGFVKTGIPHLKDLLKREDLFPREMSLSFRQKEILLGCSSKRNYHFQFVGRRFHGIWKGIKAKDCCGGNPSSLESASPTRWATHALEGSRLFYIDDGRTYQGFVHVLPMKRGDELFGALELVSPVFKKRCLMENGHHKRTCYLLIPALKKVIENGALHSLRMVIGEDMACVNDAGVRKILRLSRDHVELRPVGKAREFHFADPIAPELFRHSPRRGRASFVRDLICEVTIFQENTITEIRLSDAALKEKPGNSEVNGISLQR